MTKTLFIVTLIFLSFILCNSCTNNSYDKLYPTPVAVCDTDSVSFSKNIQPIFNANCIICHSSGGAGFSYVDLTSYNKTLSGVVNSGQLLSDITNTDISNAHHMPSGQPSLSSCEIEQISAWINQGALNN